MGVVHKPVYYGCSQFFIKQKTFPPAKFNIRRNNDAFCFITSRDNIKQQACALLMKRQIAPFVNNVSVLPKKIGRKLLTFLGLIGFIFADIIESGFFLFFNSITVALNIDSGGMVQQSIQNRSSYNIVPKNITPVPVRFV